MPEFRAWFERHIERFFTKPNDLGGGLCPIHGDHNPSLAMNLRTGWVQCFACGWEGPAHKFAREANLPTEGLPQRDRQAGKVDCYGMDRPPDAQWTYTDEQGEPLYRVLRWNDTGSGKQFRQARYEGGRYILGLRNKATGAMTPRVLYRLQDLIAADPDNPIWLTEGEKAADAGASWGLLTTTAPEGAGKFGQLDQDRLRFLSGRTVYILPDNDEPGEAHARQASGILRKLGATVRVVPLPGLPPKGDLADWIAAGNTRLALQGLAESAKEPRGKVESPEEASSILVPAIGHLGYEFNRTDLGNAEFLSALYGQDLRYSHPLKTWFVWDRRRWLADRSGRVSLLANLTARRRLEDAPGANEEDVKAEFRWGYLSESARARKACLDQATTLQELVVLPEDLDSDPWALNLANGTLDLRSGDLRPAQRQDYVTKITPIRYDPEATCPLWEAFLDRTMARNAGLKAYLQRAVGYSITGAIREHVLFLLHGAGANGKSTLVETVVALLGMDYTHRLPVEILLEQSRGSSGGASPELADLKGRRLAFSCEADQNRHLAEGTVKSLTGGDAITARRLYQDLITFRPTHKLWLTTNHKPEIRGTDDGIWRRIHLIPFQVQIPEEEQDKALPTKLLAELPGILNWAVRGCLEWQRIGLRPPPEVLAAIQNYRAESDTLAEFFSDRCILERDAEIRARDLFGSYSRWCEARREKALNMKRFGQAMTERGFEKSKNSGIFYHGIRLADVNDRDRQDLDEDQETYGLPADHDSRKYGPQPIPMTPEEVGEYLF